MIKADVLTRIDFDKALHFLGDETPKTNLFSPGDLGLAGQPVSQTATPQNLPKDQTLPSFLERLLLDKSPAGEKISTNQPLSRRFRAPIRVG
jgi:hypothetical protein